MSYKIVFTDLDDTLLNDKREVSLIDKLAIIEAQKQGIIFVLASGRPTFAMYDLAKELELDKYGGYLLSFNGSIITECKTGKNIFEATLTSDDLHILYEYSKKFNTHIITYHQDDIISETQSKYIDVEVELTHMNHKIVDSFKKEVNYPAVKCMLLEEPQYLKQVEKQLKDIFNDKYTIAISKPFFLEVTKKGIDKGIALQKLASILNINIEDTIAIGDSFNDLPMLKNAGMSIAVENAKDEIKNMCKFITKSNNDSGMAHMINTLILKK